MNNWTQDISFNSEDVVKRMTEQAERLFNTGQKAVQIQMNFARTLSELGQEQIQSMLRIKDLESLREFMTEQIALPGTLVRLNMDAAKSLAALGREMFSVENEGEQAAEDARQSNE